MAAAGVGSQQNPQSAAALRRQLQAPRGGGVQPTDGGHHGGHGRTTQTLIDRPDDLFGPGNPNDQQPIDLHAQPPHGRRIEIAPRIDDRDGAAALCGGHGGAKGERGAPRTIEVREDLGDRPARQPAVGQGPIQTGQPGWHDRPRAPAAAMLVPFQHRPQLPQPVVARNPTVHPGHGCLRHPKTPASGPPAALIGYT